MKIKGYKQLTSKKNLKMIKKKKKELVRDSNSKSGVERH